MSKATNSGGVERYRYLVVGAGVAGASAAAAINDVDPGGSVLVVGRERSRPYHRPPLSKAYLRGEIGKADLIAQPLGWFPTHGADLRTGVRVTRLDPPRRRATLDDGATVQYEQCVLAYGATVAPLEVLGAGLPGLHYLRTLDDCDQLRTRLTRALKEGLPHADGRGRAVVVGGGLLGTEVAASLTRLGLAIDLVIDAPLPWAGVAGESASRFIAGLLDRNGVTLHRDAGVAELLGDGRVQRVALDGGAELPCDFAVAAVGARVDARPVQGTRVTLGRAVLCDAFGRTDAEYVWAAGDCCAMRDERFGKSLPAGHWDVARLQGDLVGRNAATVALDGEPAAWREVRGWHSELFGVDLFAWGTTRFADRFLTRGSVNVERPDYAEIALDSDGRVCHALAVGREGEQAALRRLVEDRADVRDRETILRDPDAAV